MYKPVRVWSFKLFRAWEFCVFVIAGWLALEALDPAQLNVAAPFMNATTFLIAVLVFGAMVWVHWISKADLYASHRLIERQNEIWQLVLGAICAAGCLSILGAFMSLPTNDSVFLSTFILLLVAMTVSGRLVVRGLLRLARSHQRNLRHVAIVGGGAPVENLIWRILNNSDNGIVINGVFGTPEELRALPTEVPVGGNLDDLSERMMREPIDEVLVTYSFTHHYDELVGLIDRCRRVGVPIRMVDEYLTPFGMRPKVEYLGDAVSLVYADGPDWGWRGQIKEIIDTAVSGVALFALFPVFLLVALAIKIDSPGPVFFVQPRVGKNRVTFPFYKFRTMRQDAAAIQASLEAQNESGGPTFKMANDPRITRVGRFLRKYSIDELPQFLNVLKGDMSLVGPRPLPLRDVERFEIDWHSRRFSVKPGLTCSWVVAGRSELDFERWVEMDLAYIDNWSLKKDATIILGTIPAVFRGSGAY